MKFDQTLQPAIFGRRYKRFLVDVVLASGETITAHCPNTGRMTSCLAPGCQVLLSTSANPSRKYPYTFEMARVSGVWVGINTARTNLLVKEAIENGIVQELGAIDRIQTEVKTGEGSRLDFLLHRGGQKIYMEVKNCTLVEDGTAMFPDAVTERGTRHLRELIRLKESGHEAAIFFCVQRWDAVRFAPASHIDPLYARTLREAIHQGVQLLVYQAQAGPTEVTISHPLPNQDIFETTLLSS